MKSTDYSYYAKCKYCGSEPVIEEQLFNSHIEYRMVCNNPNCKEQPKTGYCRIKENAISEWQYRMEK